jgi:hypothetical protein
VLGLLTLVAGGAKLGCQTKRILRWWNMLNVSGFHRPALPRIQDLYHSAGSEFILRADFGKSPPRHKVELD